jgi:hypothetical protein
MISKGIRMYTVTEVLKAEEMLSPSRFPRQETEKRISQKGRNIPLISRIVLLMMTKVRVWMAEMENKMPSLERR